MDAHGAVQFAVASDRMTTAQVAERLGISIRTVLRLANDGRLPPVLKIPGKTNTYLFDRNAVEVYALRRLMALREALAEAEARAS